MILRERENIQWLEENKSRLLAGGGIFIASLLCIVLVVLYGKYKTASSLEDLRSGIIALQDGKIDVALSQLEKANTRLGSSQEGQLSRFYLSEAYTQNGKLDEAKKIAIASSSQSPGNNAYLSQMLLLTQGKNAEKQNELSVARKNYEDAAALEGPFTLDALWALARVSDLTGDTTAATVARDKILTSYPNSPFTDIIRQKLGK
jgi:tetratricopeptide (TPR) repeat protein